ncbi:MAG: SDR family oxidoreductase [Alphaproteobacteria bacterium]|nr:SDR family oxidoreductase [Alphaproteobacteria bacterium]
MRELEGRVALITGGAAGIGACMARELAARGARVVLWDLDGQRAQATAREIGHDARAYACDVSDRGQVARVAARVKEEVGPVDLLINNAGVVSGKPLLELSDEDIERTFGVNTLALFWVTRAFLGDMIARGEGHVVTVASAAGTIGVARMTDYAASKFAAVGFDESLRAELRRSAPGVKTTVVCPYYIDTGMFEGVRTRYPGLLPILEPDDVAHRVIEAIEHDRPRVVLPFLVQLVPALRVFPVALFDWAADLLGVNASMDEFIGHGEPEPEP